MRLNRVNLIAIFHHGTVTEGNKAILSGKARRSLEQAMEY
jgi:hypothetical protein